MAQVKLSYNKLINMAKQYGVEKNALFIAAANQYVLQQQVLERIKASLDEEDECTVSKEYVKGRANVYVNPLLKELPKQSDSANKTLQIIQARRTMLELLSLAMEKRLQLSKETKTMQQNAERLQSMVGISVALAFQGMIHILIVLQIRKVSLRLRMM